LTDGIVGLKTAVAPVVDNFALKFGLPTPLGDTVARRRNLVRFLILFLFLGLVGGSAAASADGQSPPATSLEPGPQFAIADFDGDLRPDVASIRAGANIAGSANYWIQLQLTSAGRQSIQLIAPAGGLLIEARDVNGDHAIDLVLATAWSRQPVAIFLNDGHGGFSRAELAAFPGAFSESKTNWVPTKNLPTDTVGVPPQSGAGICAEEKVLLHERSPARLIPPSSAGFPVSPFLASQAGRSPPSEVSYL
jgi:hypothetical protein